MKKFKFTLQTVHNVRELKQEQEELVLSEIQSEINKADLRLVEIQERRKNAVAEYSEKLQKGEPMNPYEMELNTRHISNLDVLIREAKANLEKTKTKRTIQSNIVAKANQQVKVTERLHENQKQRYQTELARHEQSALDELVSANFARQMTTTK